MMNPKVNKIYLGFLILITCFFLSCKSSKLVEQSTSTDITTIIKETPVKIEFKADTVTSGFKPDSLSLLFQNARNGAVLAKKQGKKKGVYHVIRKSGDGKSIVIESISPAKDTTIITKDVTTKISTSTEKVYQKKEPIGERLYNGITSWVFWLVMVLLGLFVLRFYLKK